MQVYDSESTRR